MIKVLTIFGTRPEAIKMCPVVLEMRKHSEIENRVCITGQHREMLHPVLKAFDVTPDIDLDLMRPNQTLSMITEDVLEKVGTIIDEYSPDIVLVHGDTTTAFASALASFYRKIPVGHIEAGLRTNNIFSPFPEEFNRKSIDMVSEVFFAPTELTKNNLLKEGINSKKIVVTGNTVIDAMSITVDDSYIDENIEWANGSKLILLTAHRRENIGVPMQRMFAAVKRIVEEFEDVKCIYPVHMNPKVRSIAREVLNDDARIRLIEPLDVVQFHNYINNSYLVLTDSGGIQEEAPSLNKPVLVMRETTERPEGIEAGTLKLVGTEEDSIFNAVKELLVDKNIYNKMSTAPNPYGDGHASERIVAEIIRRFG
ncbi:UDP-N-acetylglucosamine 2-epimerase (non-hydrolysing) [Pseudobutyrivibrio sp. NOR37]|uniref:UDP-N-acetylglucosamine 2-epimerase (non-hydrolyzing) n=1 Tax=Pseudobutyrivibrio xylanivorans TaxID=185007 RepID=A0A6M0LH48_PSEXY|nr:MULTISPECIES: UDP-N-acetylglucosamine 2-epimerase (non-hydrolyzing) [Pseudobutyrivibrio]NEX01862.1 UDP-N-acetylglucosamine 2-epimerase (non-hydrolyzing) [Pseudobutyrivibrio xylanivorans]SFR72330.1 UDP-N-acetylglucosamine 2-epimerase (non-hydrolysing) [Pseudobutyrivibrio sp. NOR37]